MEALLIREEVAVSYNSSWISELSKKAWFFHLASNKRRGVILTAEMLKEMKVPCISWCFMCKGSDEDVNHLLINCQVASRLWWEILGWFGISWLMSDTVKEAISSWSCGRMKKRQRSWNVSPLALM